MSATAGVLRRDVAGRRSLIARSRKLIAYWLGELRHLLHRRRGERFAMFDSVDLTQFPPNTPAVAGYVDGRYVDFYKLITRFPHARRLSITISAAGNAHCLDIERGDAAPADAPGWVARQHARGVKRPCLYADLSTMPAVRAALRRARIPRSRYRLWVADYTYVAHIPHGYDACQWTDRAMGRNLDKSLCEPDFL